MLVLGGRAEAGRLAELVDALSKGGGVDDVMQRVVGSEGKRRGGRQLEGHGRPVDSWTSRIGGDVWLDGLEGRDLGCPAQGGAKFRRYRGAQTFEFRS